MTKDNLRKSDAKRTLRQIIKLLDREIERMDAEAARTAQRPWPAARALQPHELN